MILKGNILISIKKKILVFLLYFFQSWLSKLFLENRIIHFGITYICGDQFLWKVNFPKVQWDENLLVGLFVCNKDMNKWVS